jgi:hypothetical protein
LARRELNFGKLAAFFSQSPLSGAYLLLQSAMLYDLLKLKKLLILPH